MLIPKVILHPLREISFMIEDDIEMTKKENKIIKEYIKLHDHQYEFEKLTHSVQKEFSAHHQVMLEVKNEFLVIEPMIYQLIENEASLLKPLDNFKTFRQKFDSLMSEGEKYGLAYSKFIKRFNTMIDEWRKIDDAIIQLANKDGAMDKMHDDFNDLDSEFDDNEYPSYIDEDSFAEDQDLFRDKNQQIYNNFIELDDATEKYFNQEFNPFIERYNNAITKHKKFYSEIKNVHKAYLFYTKAKEASEGDKIYIEWTKQKLFKDLEEAVDYGVSYDEEYGKNGEITFHLDTVIRIEDVLEVMVRNSYLMQCSFKEIFTTEVLEPLIGHNLDLASGEITQNVKKNNIDFDLKMIEANYNTTQEVTKILIEGVTSKESFDVKDENYYKEVITYKNPAEVQTLGVPSLNIMNQLFFLNNNFDNKRNREIFNNYFSLSNYITLEFLLPKSDKGPISLNSNQYILFLIILDCTCQLLVGDHAEEFYEGLKKVGINAERRKIFMKSAQQILKIEKEHFKETNSVVTPLETRYDWNKIFF